MKKIKNIDTTYYIPTIVECCGEIAICFLNYIWIIKEA